MASTKQTQAIALANEMLAFMTQAQTLADSANSILTRHANLNAYNLVYVNLPTAALNSDGSVSGTPDGTPTTTHPITSPSLTRAVTAVDLSTAKTFITDFQNFMTNAAVSTSNRRASIDPLVGG